MAVQLQDRYREERQELVGLIRDRGVDDARILQVFETVPRHMFVPATVRKQAYDDIPLPIGDGQTISQPSLVAAMTAGLELCGTEKVLEIGTGSGFQTAILSQLAKDVYTVERIATMAKQAKQRFRNLGLKNIFVLIGDGSLGWPDHAPFDAIIVTAAAPQIPSPLMHQLKLGGRMVIPIGNDTYQRLLIGVRDDDELIIESDSPVRFVPLIGAFGF